MNLGLPSDMFGIQIYTVCHCGGGQKKKKEFTVIFEHMRKQTTINENQQKPKRIFKSYRHGLSGKLGKAEKNINELEDRYKEII